MKRAATLLGILTLSACGDGESTSGAGAPDAAVAPAVPEGSPVDPAQVAACVACHGDTGTAWARLSSHSLLLDCAACHAVQPGDAGPGHARTSSCRRCHSERTHPEEAPCLACHDPHGAANLFLLRPRVPLPAGGEAAVTVLQPAGASEGGLARADGGAAGLCEACHATTTYYRADGTGAPHERGWCVQCHQHGRGFAAH
ncbi:MAG: hypothetical protein HY904_24480 [Deltaproteobacteria bacterium]|nr:hypothetical protein [Deltaproteobacteria bacterium]